MTQVKRVASWFGVERHRAYLYRVFGAGGAVALSYGLVSTDEVFVWSGFVATVFLLPAANTSTSKES